MKGLKVCELCPKEAALYCDADHAFLCWTCDAEVHRANFLVARHLRQPLCSSCNRFTGDALSGSDLRRALTSPICRSCSPEELPGEASSSDQSSVCLSSSESKLQPPEKKQQKKKKKIMSRVCSSSSVTELSGEVSSEKAIASECNDESDTKEKIKKKVNDENSPGVDAKAEGIFGNWCRELGLSGNSAIVAVSVASQALGLRVGRVLPFRVALAASFWCGLRSLEIGDHRSSARGIHALRRLAEVSGVPAKLILAVGSRIDRELRGRRSSRRDLEEGSAECSG